MPYRRRVIWSRCELLNAYIIITLAYSRDVSARLTCRLQNNNNIFYYTF